MSDTIAAIATGGGVAAIGIVRVSGPKAIEIADKMFRIIGGGRLINAEARKMYYGELYGSCHNENRDKLIDICLCMISRGTFSYTGEDSVEFHCHGSPVVLSEVLRALLSQGARQALPGEFTKRAFLNGRMDLTQAEAVIDIIEAETPLAARNAVGQLQGSVSVQIESIYTELINIMAHFHAVLDYPDEDIDEFKLQNYLSTLQNAETTLAGLMASHERGRIMRDGIKTAIIGKPNTGKSSLLNALLGYNRAIVTNIAGTTRDTVEEKVLIGNVSLRLIDTAGLRHTDEVVEKLGVERTLSALQNAQLILLILDGSKPLQNDDLDILLSIPQEVPKIIIVNKIDLPCVINNNEISEHLNNSQFSILNSQFLRVSALTGEGLDGLESEITRQFPEPDKKSVGEIITNTRQYDAITRAKSSISETITAISSSLTPDVVLTEIEAALNAIGEVTGKSMREDIISRIFERFCVGK